MPDALPAAVAESIRAALRDGRKIEAIKIYREFSGVGLAEAKTFIDQYETAASEAGPSAAPPPAHLEQQIRQALIEGRTIEAIKLYRGMTKVGLKEAKENIERIAEALRVGLPVDFTPAPATQAGKGCLVMIVATMLGGAIVGCRVVLW